MEKQTIINAIAVLSGTIGALNACGEIDAVKEIKEKILELVRQL